MNLLLTSLRPVPRRSCVKILRPFTQTSTLNALKWRDPGTRRRRRGRREEDVNDDRDWEPGTNAARPDSASFYTGRPVYYDQVILLQGAIAQARNALKRLHLLPLPEFARKSLPSLRPVWKEKREMDTYFQTKMTTSRYRRVIILLNELNGYHNIATTADCIDLQKAIEQIVSLYQSGKKASALAQLERKKGRLDDFGRSYALGKRKTSSARVWMIPVHNVDSGVEGESIEELFGIKGSRSMAVPTTTILVNNIPLAEYFPLPADRERIMRTFKLAGVVGAYNVFALVRGGGTTGQSGALAHGIAKALVIHEPGLERLLKRTKLTRRDPRMVERKKTGLAKARKRYTWVKR